MDSLNLIAYEGKPDLVLWPESALPAYLRVSSIKNKLKEVVKDFNIPALIGTLDVSWQSNKRKVFNGSIYLGIEEEKMYHKIFLVPFAEYNPLTKIDFLKNISYWDFDHGSFTPGIEHTIFNIDSIRFSNVICYESSHPKISRKMILNGARFLTIQANDAWLSNSSGVIQHFELARLRAVELRTGIARSANTGISGIIYPDGKIGGKIPFDHQGVLKNNVILNNGLSIYAKFGSVFAYICLIFFNIINYLLMFFKKNKIILLFVLKINLLFSQDSPAFEISPGVKSLIFPGWGQASLLHKKRAKIFYYSEASILLFFLSTKTYSNILRRNYIAFAANHANLNPFGKTHDYWVDIGNFSSISSYNEEYLRNRRNDDLYPNNEMWYWSWDTELNQKFFENKRIKSDQYSLIAKFGIGFLFLNHALSMIDAFYLNKLKNNENLSLDITYNDFLKTHSFRLKINF